jgi:glycosyltransferase involved in cell wall biosynthesis
MRILFVNTSDQGGAAKACLRLCEALRSEQVIVSILLKTESTRIKNSCVAAKKTSLPLTFRERLREKSLRLGREFKLIAQAKKRVDPNTVFLNQRPSGLEYFSFPNSNYDITDSPLYQEADIIHLHWVADFLDWESFFSKNTKPVVWTLHDQNPFLGGQHYDERYLGLNYQGLACLRIKTEIEILKEVELLAVKIKALKGKEKIYIVAPSKWLYDSSLNSSLFGTYNHQLIPNGIPTRIFKPTNREYCRDVFGLPNDKKVVLFVADSLENSRKGYIYLKRALAELSDEILNGLVLCAVGSKSELEENNKVIELGKIQDERLMAMTYAAVDLFVIPSLEDNLPNTMLESLCCGTPVLGFPTGGIVDAIEDGVNGLLCDEISVNALVKGLNRFLSGEVVFDREAISKIAKERFDLAKQANAYIGLYREILSNTQEKQILIEKTR